jgi:hypothetical protein
MVRALLSIAFFAGFVIGGGSAFAQTAPEKSRKPEARQLAQLEREHPAEVEAGDDKAAREQEVRQDREREGAAEDVGEPRGRETEQEIEHEGEHHQDRDRNRGRDQERGQEHGSEHRGGGHQ